MTEVDVTPGRRRLPADERRRQLLETAASLLVSGETLTMEAIGERAGASKTLAYAYFTNVGEVARTLFEDELARLYQRVQDATAGVDDFDGRLAAAVRAYFDTVQERGHLLSRLEGITGARRRRRDLGEPTNRFLAWFARLIREEFGLGKRRSLAYAALLAGVADGHARIWTAGGFSRSEVEESCVCFMRAGIRAALEEDPFVRV